jgi:hypothetical protein
MQSYVPLAYVTLPSTAKSNEPFKMEVRGFILHNYNFYVSMVKVLNSHLCKKQIFQFTVKVDRKTFEM